MITTLKSFLFGISLLFVSFNFSFSQTFGEPFMGSGRINGGYTFLGVFGKKEIWTFYNSIIIYEDGKKTSLKYPKITFNGEVQEVGSFFVKDDKMVGYFMGGKNGSEGVHVCFQEFTLDLKPIGEPKIIAELPKAVDQKEVASTAVRGVFKNTFFERQTLYCDYNTESGNILITFVLHLHRKQAESYGMLMLLDEEYNVLTDAVIEPSSKENFFKMNVEKIYKSGESLISIYEGSESYTSDGTLYTIKSTSMIYLPSDGSEIVELELMPTFGYVGEIIPSVNVSDEGTICYGILSREAKEHTNRNAAMQVYFYNPKSKKEWTHTVSDKLISELNDAPIAHMDKNDGYISFLRNEELLIATTFESQTTDNDVSKVNVLRLNRSLDAISSNRFGVFTDGGSLHSEPLFHLDDSKNNLYMIQNIHPDVLKDGKLNKIVKYVDSGSVPMICKMDLNTNEASYSLLGAGKYKFKCIEAANSKVEGNDDVYYLRAIVDRKLQCIPVTFD